MPLNLLIALSLGAVVGLAFLERLIRRPTIGAIAIITLVLMGAGYEVPDVIIDGFRVSATDVVMGALLVAAAARVVRMRRLSTPHALLLGLLGMVLLSVVRGMAQFGINTSVNQARGVLPFIVAAVFFSTITPTPAFQRLIGRLWLFTGGALAVLAMLRWVAVAAGVQVAFLMPTASFGRVVRFSEALILVQVALLCLPAIQRRLDDPRHRNLVLLFLPAAVLVQHRTAWAALLVGIAVMVVMDVRLGRRLGAGLVVLAIIGAAFSLGTDANRHDESLEDSLVTTATTTDTFVWRLEGWEQLLASTSRWDILDQLIGDPMGTSFRRTVQGSVTTESSPHNYYLQIYLRTGLIGLVLLVCTYGAVLHALRKRHPELVAGAFSAAHLIIAMVMHLVLFISYAPDFEQGILLGLGVGVAASSRQAIQLGVQEDHA